MNRDKLAKLRLYRAAASVTRVHTRRVIYRQSVGEHTFGVLALIRLITDEPSTDLLLAAMDHDIPEAVTGDMPSPTKLSAGMKDAMATLEHSIEQRYSLKCNLTVYEERVLKFCDIMELAMYSCEEADMGNRYAALMMRRCLRAINNLGLATVTSEALEIFEMMEVRCLGFGDKCGEDVLHRTDEY